MDLFDLICAGQALALALREWATMRQQAEPSVSEATFTCEDGAIVAKATLNGDFEWRFWLRSINPGYSSRHCTLMEWWSASDRRWVAWDPTDLVTRIGKL